MKQKNADKIKLIKLLEILRQNSDDDNPLTTNEIIDQLNQQGITCRRETLYKDIKVLNEYGYEIISHRGTMNEYFIADRSFSLPELRIIIDSIQAASFVTKKKTKELIDKVADLGGSHRAELLKHDSNFVNLNKHTNEHIYYNINEIELAINQNKKISFKYFDYNDKLDKVYRKDGKKYYINPYSMIVNNDNYYLIGYNDLYEKVLHYRIDRMSDVKISHYDIVKCGFMKDFDINQYIKQLFGMYSGEEQEITIEFDKSLLDVVFDKFGEKIKITKISENTYSVNEKVRVSPVFIGWILSFGCKLKITGPKELVDELNSYIVNLLKVY